MENIEEGYLKLKECYTSNTSNNYDKAKRFRSIFEEFVKMYVPNTKQHMLGEILKEFFGQLKDKLPNAYSNLKCRLSGKVNSFERAH